MKGRKIVRRAIRLVGCAGVGVVGVVIDVPALCGIAVAKSPILLWKGWKQQILNMEACVEEGSCPRPMCLPLTGAMLLLWPATVAASIGSAVLYSLKKGLYGAVVAYREESIRCGLKHVVAAIAEYDEFTNDVALLREGSCLPRPNYHKQQQEKQRKQQEQQQSHENDRKKVRVHVIREFELTRLLKFLTSSHAREKGKRLVEAEFISIGTGNKLTSSNLESSVAFTILSFLVHSAAELQAGLGQDQNDHHPDAVVDGDESFVLYDPLETLERQIRDAKLRAVEQQYLEEIVLLHGARSSSNGAESDAQEQDPLRRATLQGFGRRIRGIAAFVSRDASFRRHFGQYVHSVLADFEDMISFD